MGGKADKITTVHATINVVKAVMGAGSFALPWAFSTAGVVLGPLALFVLVGLAFHTACLLLQLKGQAGRLQACLAVEDGTSGTLSQVPVSTYVDVVRVHLGPGGARVCVGASLGCSLGVCGAYIVFVSSVLQGLLPVRVPQVLIIAGLTPIAVWLVVVPSIRKLSDISAFGDICVLAAMGCVVWDACSRPLTFPRAAFSFSTYHHGFGSVAFLFGVHFLLIPIEHAMEQPHKAPLAIATAFICCAVISGIFGVVGLLAYGPIPHDIVLFDVTQGKTVTVAKLLLCLDLLATFPLVMRPGVQVAEAWVLRTGIRWLPPPAVRTILVVVTALAAVVVPTFGVLTGVVGGVSQALCAFVLPPIMALQSDVSWGKRTWYISLTTLGALMMLSSCVGAVQQLLP